MVLLGTSLGLVGLGVKMVFGLGFEEGFGCLKKDMVEFPSSSS